MAPFYRPVPAVYASAIGIHRLNALIAAELCSQILCCKYVRIKLGFNCIHFQPNGVPSKNVCATTVFSEIYELDIYIRANYIPMKLTQLLYNNKALL